MSTIAVRDHVIRPKHIVGDDALKERLLALKPGEVVIIRIGGKSGAWVRMAQGDNPVPTPGLKPACDTTRDWWHEMQQRRGELVTIEEVTP